MARDNPEALITEPVDIEEGMTDEISMRVVKAIGFEGKQAEQVSNMVWLLPAEIYFYLLFPRHMEGKAFVQRKRFSPEESGRLIYTIETFLM